MSEKKGEPINSMIACTALFTGPCLEGPDSQLVPPTNGQTPIIFVCAHDVLPHLYRKNRPFLFNES